MISFLLENTLKGTKNCGLVYTHSTNDWRRLSRFKVEMVAKLQKNIRFYIKLALLERF